MIVRLRNAPRSPLWSKNHVFLGGGEGRETRTHIPFTSPQKLLLFF